MAAVKVADKSQASNEIVVGAADGRGPRTASELVSGSPPPFTSPAFQVGLQAPGRPGRRRGWGQNGQLRGQVGGSLKPRPRCPIKNGLAHVEADVLGVREVSKGRRGCSCGGYVASGTQRIHGRKRHREGGAKVPNLVNAGRRIKFAVVRKLAFARPYSVCECGRFAGVLQQAAVGAQVSGRRHRPPPRRPSLFSTEARLPLASESTDVDEAGGPCPGVGCG
jgi:hypothetical protein